MVDYSKMSDFEINNLVAVQCNISHVMYFHSESEVDDIDNYCGPIWECPSHESIGQWSPSKGNMFLPCHNISDAWPVINENLICINYHSGKGVHVYGYNDNGLCETYVPYPMVLRGCMEVFLMMQDSNNG